MHFDNFTPVPAILWRTTMPNNRIAAAVVARTTWAIVDGRLLLDNEQPWLASSTEWESPIGPMPADDCFVRGGVDIIVLGSARAPGGRPVPKVEVRAVCGDWVGGVDVHGERCWAPGFSGQLAPTAAVPFIERPLTLDFAFGGVTEWDGLESPHPANPKGRGFYFAREQAETSPLANIEDPRHPVLTWDQRPEPVGVGFCPREFGPRAAHSVEFDERGVIRKLHKTFFNDAFPAMIAPSAEPGRRVALWGVDHDGPICFTLPSLPLLTRVQIGDQFHDRLMSIDQIGIEPDRRRVFITYRFPFRYSITRMQPRACSLYWAPRTPETSLDHGIQSSALVSSDGRM